MISVEDVASDSSRDVPLPTNSGSGVRKKHPSTVLMCLLNTPEVEGMLVRRVHDGYGDVYKSSGDARILTLELDFLTCENATAMASKIAEEIASTGNTVFELRCAISYEIVPGEGGELTNICIAVSSDSQISRRTLRYFMSTFLLRCFRRNLVGAYFLKQVGIPRTPLKRGAAEVT